MIKMKCPACIYSRDSIMEAAAAYSALASIEVQKVTDSYMLLFSDCKYDEQTTVCEFENYLIGLENT